jgi:DNA-binding SARP family transcriptional activator/tetratricopeptide (TPR) repeat protein/biotin operon repressor
MDQTLRIHLLGSVRIETATRGLLRLPSGLAELVAFIALAGSGGAPVRRDAAAFALWPDLPEDRARRSLAAALYRLRLVLPERGWWLSTSRETVALRSTWLDTDAFAALADSRDPADWRAALDLYSGDLLPSIDAEWADGPRAILRERSVALLAQVTAERETAGELADALTWARRWSVAEPLDETAHRAIMRLYARLDRHAAALDHFDRLVARLHAELGVEPQRATREIAERIRAELGLASEAATAIRSAPLVGRTDERNRLLELLDRAGTGRGALAVVLGEAGIGKSRLLQEIDGSARWRGWQVAYGRGEQFGSPEPYAPLSTALAAAIPPARREQLRGIVEPVWLAGASVVLPDLAAGAPAWDSDLDVGRLARAVGEVLGGLGRISPHVLLLDDVQWADAALWPLLDGLRPTLAGTPILVVVAGRSEELASNHAAWRLLETWDRALVPFVHLRGLEIPDLEALSSGFDGRSRSADEVATLAAASGGNPLLALALLQSGDAAPRGPVGHGDLRASLDRLFEHRLAGLSPAARAALDAAAVVGQHVPYPLWREVAGDGALPERAGELERARLVRLDGDGYAFAHDTLRSLVVWGLSPERRRALHAVALEAQKRRGPHDALGLLYHAEQVGDVDEIATWAARAGEQALAGMSFDAARRHFSRCLEVLPGSAREARYRSLLGRVRACDVLADRDAQRADLSELEDLAVALGGSAQRIETARQLAGFHWAVGEYAAGEAVATRGLELAVAAGDVDGEAALLTLIGRILREEGRLSEAEAAVTRARTRYERLDDAHGSATALELLAGIHWRLGDHRTAARQHAEAAQRFEDVGDLRRAAISLNSVGTVLWSLGDYEGSRAVHERSLATCRALGDRRVESDNLDNLGGVAWILADFEGAIALYTEALAIRRESRDPRGTAISLINLGDTYALTGEPEAALAAYDEALEIDRYVGVRRNEATALQGKGKALLEAGRPEEARACLEAARALHVSLGDRDNLADALAALALVCLETGDSAAAREAVAEALEQLDPNDRATLREWVRFAAWRVAVASDDPAQAAAHLAAAAAAMDEFVSALPEDARSRVLARVPIHRRTRAAREAATRRVTVMLPRTDVPLGRPVAVDELVRVDWTVVDPTDALVDDDAERRRRVAARLLAEAAAQGASVTDDDLARVLGVSRRTILRDAQALRGTGQALQTRRRSRVSQGRPTGD